MKTLWFLTLTMLLSGCLLESVRPVDRNPIPYGAHWVKAGITVEQSRQDSWGCGAANTAYAADHVVFTVEQTKAARLPEDANDIWADARLRKQWAACMRSKGYTYIEQPN